MRYSLSRIFAWSLALLAVALGPMLLAYLGPGQPRDFWVEVGVGLGFLGLSLLLLQFVLIGRYRQVAESFGLDSMLQFHKQLGLIALLLILAHPVVLFLTDPDYLEYLDPRVNFLRALSLSGVTGALLLLVASSLWRVTFRLNYEWWRVVHGSLAAFILLIGIVHPIQVGHYVTGPWLVGLFAAMGVGALALLVNTRIIRPWRMRSRPWRLVEVRQERGEAATLVLEPNGHDGFRFEPGQFAWITINDTPFTLQQHPFSFSSSADAAPGRLEFTIKGEGDFSTWARQVDPGLTVFLEGPYGAFVPPRDPEVGCVMILGGVGVTPCMSMLRTFSDRGDTRPLVLIYANQDLDSVIFHDEIEELRESLDLEVVHVLEEPPEDWEGEEGMVDRDLLARHLPDDGRAYDHFVCGPEPMMDVVEKSLLDLDVPQRHILSERFDMV